MCIEWKPCIRDFEMSLDITAPESISRTRKWKWPSGWETSVHLCRKRSNVRQERETSEPDVPGLRLREKDFGVSWISMRRWYLYLVLVLLVVVIVAFPTVFKWNLSMNVAEVWNLVHQPKKKQSEPAKEEGNAVLLEVLELRQRHHLRPLTDVEHGTKIQNLPRGIYGFPCATSPHSAGDVTAHLCWKFISILMGLCT